MDQTKRLNFGYLPYIDGLRALSILAVMSFHGTGPVSTTIFGSNGWIGVNLFFVISGFLITTLLLVEHNDTGKISFKNFYMRRILRIAPAYYFRVGFAGLLNFFNCTHMTIATLIAFIYMTDYDLALNWANIGGSGLEFTWSLAIEEKFYLIWPLILALCTRKLLPIVISTLVASAVWKAILIQQHASWLRLTGAFDTRLDCILWGCLVALLWASGTKRSLLTSLASKRFVPYVMILLVWAIMYCIGHPSAYKSRTAATIFWLIKEPLFNATSAFLILSLVTNNGLLNRFLALAPMVWVGKLSYSLYLWHGQGFNFIERYGHKISALGPVAVESINFLAAFALACLSYYFIEKPFLKLKYLVPAGRKSGHEVGLEQSPTVKEPELAANSRV